MAFNKYDVLSYAIYHYYSFNPHYHHYRSYTVFIFLKRQHVIQKHPLSCSSCREVMQDKEDLREKFGQSTKFSFLGPGNLHVGHLKGRDPVCDLRSKQSGEHS